MIELNEAVKTGAGPIVTFLPHPAKRRQREELRSESRRDEPYLMMARYYGSSLGRFESPDPGADMDLESPQSWNKYTYVRNNPLVFTDPTGEYVCKGSKSQCGQIKQGLKDTKKAMKSYKRGSKERKALKNVLKAYGREGQKNGVTVKFGNAGGGEAKTENSGAETTVTFDTAVMASTLSSGRGGSTYSAEIAASVSHEGQHVIQQKDHGMPKTRAEEKAGEVEAYSSQALVNQGLNTNSIYGLWNQTSGMNEAKIEVYAEESTIRWCGGTCQ